MSISAWPWGDETIFNAAIAKKILRAKDPSNLSSPTTNYLTNEGGAASAISIQVIEFCSK